MLKIKLADEKPQSGTDIVWLCAIAAALVTTVLKFPVVFVVAFHINCPDVGAEG